MPGVWLLCLSHLRSSPGNQRRWGAPRASGLGSASWPNSTDARSGLHAEQMPPLRPLCPGLWGDGAGIALSLGKGPSDHDHRRTPRRDRQSLCQLPPLPGGLSHRSAVLRSGSEDRQNGLIRTTGRRSFYCGGLFMRPWFQPSSSVNTGSPGPYSSCCGSR